MQMPRNGFDNLAAVARMNTDDTSHHPLAWVWDELDMERVHAIPMGCWS